MPNKGKLLDHYWLLKESKREHYLYEIWGEEDGPYYAECMCPWQGVEHERKIDAAYDLREHLVQMWTIRHEHLRVHVMKRFKVGYYYFQLCACGWLSDPLTSQARATEEREYHLRLVTQYGHDARTPTG
jgi:hypothetical protein